jgi:fumarate reductase subunit D
MQELVYTETRTIWQLISIPVIILVIGILLPPIVRAFRKYMVYDVETKKQFRITYLVIIFLSIMACLIFYNRILFAIDLATDNIRKITVEVPKPYYENHDLYIDVNDTTLFFVTYFISEVEEHYVGNLCEIEYYNNSKRIRSIKRLDEE